MSTRRFVILPAVVSFAMGVALTAQAADVVPLKHWSAPLYWQPTQPQDETASATVSPQATSPDGALVFVAMTPCRVIDTRNGQGFTGAFGPPSLVGGASRTFPVQSSLTCAIPSIARAYSFNVTVVPPGPLGFLTVYPTGQPLPLAATLNSLQGFIVNNAAIAPAGTGGSVDVYATNATDLIIDINGYYAPQTGLTLAQGSASTPSLSFSGDVGTGIFSSGTGTVNIATGGTNRLSVLSNGDLDLGGNILRDGRLFISAALRNTSAGILALNPANTGDSNTALGLGALRADTTGSFNTALGADTLQSNTAGNDNTAVGNQALFSNTTGIENTAIGSHALQSNTTGMGNTAQGRAAMQSNTTGSSNTAQGDGALQSNTTGAGNVAQGTFALLSNTTGFNNTAQGVSALYANTIGTNDTAVGNGALGFISAGSDNTALGAHSLFSMTAGSNNIAVGSNAGTNLTTGSNNIEIGNQGLAADAGIIRIGSPGVQSSAFISGIRSATTGSPDAVPVVVDSNGQLGTVSSSRRFKEGIEDMGEASSGLLRLRPVRFRYKQPYADGSKPLDYGLIAEEVAEVYPDLVVKGADGQLETVQYQKLTPMLLNELQKQRQRAQQQDEIIRQLGARLSMLEALLSTGQQ
jgi:hypothetical protein